MLDMPTWCYLYQKITAMLRVVAVTHLLHVAAGAIDELQAAQDALYSSQLAQEFL